jgi:hypothetical protein
MVFILLNLYKINKQQRGLRACKFSILILLTNIYLQLGRLSLALLFCWISMFKFRKAQQTQPAMQFLEKINFQLGILYADIDYSASQGYISVFSSSSYFCKCFKKRYRTLPLQLI